MFVYYLHGSRVRERGHEGRTRRLEYLSGEVYYNRNISINCVLLLQYG